MDNRKLNRLINYDYSSNGLYFVTICTKDRVQYLSEITTGNGELIENYTEHGNFVGDGVLDVPNTISSSNKYIIICKWSDMITYLIT